MLIGPGGVGKGTVARQLDEADPRLWLSRSWTTRARREGERVDAYVFTDREEFLAEVDRGGFLEWAEFLGNLYGTPVPRPPDGSDILLEIDVQGARQVVGWRPDATVVLLLPPSREAIEERLRRRGDDAAQARRRLEVGESEVSEGRALATAEVVNDELGQAVDEVAAIIEAARRAHC